MFDFSSIEEIKLSRGSHSSPQEGLCILEMVSWFAGEKHSDKPDCACPVLGAYAINLNDRMPDDVRDRLLKPLVPLISGTRDKASERPRAEFLAMWTVNKILPAVLRKQGFADHAAACENARTLVEARAAAAAYDAAADVAFAATAAAAAAAAADVWALAVEGLRQAILIGRHDGFDVAAPVLTARREKLRELVG